MNVLVYLIILVVLYLLWILTIRYGLKHLWCSRAFSTDALFEGESCELVEIVRNDKPILIPWLRLESRISPHLHLGNQENLNVSGEMYYCSLFTMAPYQQIKRRYKVRFTRRGYYDLGNASLTVGDVLGLFKIQRNQELSAPICIYPQLLEQEDLPSPISRLTGELVRRRQLLEDPFLVRGIRAYRPGDPVRDIHWPATARVGETQVRVHDYSAQTKLLVILNVQRDEMQWGDVLPEEDEAITEYGISLAATICVQAIRGGMPVGFMSNMPQGNERKGVTLLMPDDQPGQEEAILSACAGLNTICGVNILTMLRDMDQYSGLDILILSRYDAEGLQEEMEKLRQGGNQVYLHVVEKEAEDETERD
jgi:hypothetical protein